MEKFHYENVSAKMNTLNTVFVDFMKLLDTLDTKLNDNFNVGDSAALHGVAASQLIKSWNACSDTFVNFRTEFDNLFNLVKQVSNNNANYEAEVMAMYGSSSGEA